MTIITVDENGQQFVTPDELDEFEYYRDNIFVRTYNELLAVNPLEIDAWQYSLTQATQSRAGLAAWEFGAEKISYNMYLYIPNITINQGVTITSAYLSLIATLTGSYDQEINVEIGAYNADDTSYPSGIIDFQSKFLNQTTAKVTWDDDEVTWIGGTRYSSPSLITIIQEIINRSGWSNGNGILIFLANQYPLEDITKFLMVDHRTSGDRYQSLYINGTEYIVSQAVEGSQTIGNGFLSTYVEV